jgi:hypothetical protein
MRATVENKEFKFYRKPKRTVLKKYKVVLFKVKGKGAEIRNWGFFAAGDKGWVWFGRYCGIEFRDFRLRAG